jgi:phage terminase large subunit-like protein
MKRHRLTDPPKKKDTRTPGDQVIDWIEKVCFIPEGRHIGRAVVLRDWQRADIKKIYDNPHGTRRAILSVGRKNAKTSTAAFLLLAHLAGPRFVPNSQMYSTAQSREQAAVLFGLAAKTIRISPLMQASFIIRDTLKEIFVPEIGTHYRALSAEASTAYGLSPTFIVHDELGQVRGPRSPLYEALETATGAQESPLSLIISTQAPSDNDLLSILIDDAIAGHDPHTVVSLYTAPISMDPFSEESIKLANPAYGDFLNEKEVRQMAESAKRMPAREPEYRNLVLNQRVEMSNPFVTRQLWQACGTPAQPLHGVPVYAGLDLSEVRDLTAFVMIGKIGRTWHVHPTFWLPSQGLIEKAQQDRVPYDLWYDKGFLRTTPGASISYEYIAEFLRAMFSTFNIRKLAFDRWNMRHLSPWLLHVGFTEQMIKERFVEFGQGTQSMSPALRDLESLILEREIAHGDHPVLSMCASQAVVDSKDGSNRKLSKARSSGRIDGMVALAMAVGVAPLRDKVVDISAMIG